MLFGVKRIKHGHSEILIETNVLFSKIVLLLFILIDKDTHVRCELPHAKTARPLHSTKLFSAALNPALCTAYRSGTLNVLSFERTVSWLSRIQWFWMALLPCLSTRPILHKLRVTNTLALCCHESPKSSKEMNWESMFDRTWIQLSSHFVHHSFGKQLN